MVRYKDELWTFQDAVERVLDTFGEERDEGRNRRQAQASVVEAHRELPNWGDWQHLMTTSVFLTEATYSTGTVTYVSATRTLTLVGGVWPANAIYGDVVINSEGNKIRFPIAERTSDTVVILDASLNPTGDIATASTFTWYRDEYELPAEARKNIDLFDLENESSPFALRYVTEAMIKYEENYLWYRWFTTDANVPLPIYEEPTWYTIGRTTRYDSGYSLKFAQVPATARRYQLAYWRSFRRLRYEKIIVPNLTVSADSKTVTASAAAFTAEHVGAILRLSPSVKVPTRNAVGFDMDSEEESFLYQGTIESLTSSTVVELSHAAPSALTTVTGIISDPLDIDHEILLTPLLAASEAFMARRQNRKDYERWDAERLRSIRMAREHDEDFRRSRGKHLYGAY